jgi:hypothetical protein
MNVCVCVCMRYAFEILFWVKNIAFLEKKHILISFSFATQLLLNFHPQLSIICMPPSTIPP